MEIVTHTYPLIIRLVLAEKHSYRRQTRYNVVYCVYCIRTITPIVKLLVIKLIKEALFILDYNNA